MSCLKLATWSLIALVICFTGAARASVLVDVHQSGSDVVATASGTLDLTSLSSNGNAGWSAAIWGHFGILFLSSQINPSADSFVGYSGYSGPASFGPGNSQIFATSGFGTSFGLYTAASELYVPVGYVSGTAISSMSIWANETLANLGVTPGTYTYTWGTGRDADAIIVQIDSPAPEPASGCLLAGAAALFALLRSRRLRAS